MTFGRLTVGGGFVVVWIMMLWLDKENILPLFMAAAVLHEFGHWLAVRLAGGQIAALRLTMLGAEMYTAGPLSYPREIVTTLAGPLCSLTVSVLASLAGRAFENETAYLFSGMNAVFCLFNLLPSHIFDGGRILHLSLSWRLGIVIADRVLFITDIFCAALLAGAGFYSYLQTGAHLLLILSLGYLIAIFRKNDPYQRNG